ncbi:hypothetical protein F5X99DRAFT_410568 [Biscogniauxia marginata]|nr:hypothetical protein F5X99DRAFT_410568 [Biscogniauxia marginata]
MASDRSSEPTITTKAARGTSDTSFLEKLYSKFRILKQCLNRKAHTPADVESDNKRDDKIEADKLEAESLQTCFNCGNTFDPAANKDDSCHYHPERFTEWIYSGMNWKGEEVADLEQWTCCLEIQPQHPGCKVGKHQSRPDKIRS